MTLYETDMSHHLSLSEYLDELIRTGCLLTTPERLQSLSVGEGLMNDTPIPGYQCSQIKRGILLDTTKQGIMRPDLYYKIIHQSPVRGIYYPTAKNERSIGRTDIPITVVQRFRLDYLGNPFRPASDIPIGFLNMASA